MDIPFISACCLPSAPPYMLLAKLPLLHYHRTSDPCWAVDQRSIRCPLGSPGVPLWGPPGGLFGGILGCLGVLLWASWAPPGDLGGHLRVEGSKYQFVLPLLGPSRGRPGALFGCIGALLDYLGTLLGASLAVLWRSWGPLGPSLTPCRRTSRLH